MQGPKVSLKKGLIKLINKKGNLAQKIVIPWTKMS